MVHYRVFLGAPSPSDIAKSPSSYVWKTTENTLAPSLRPSYSQYNPSVVYPPATLDAASRRVSLLYQNIIFKDADEEEEGKADEAPGYGYRESQEVDDRDSQRERTTFVTWPPTPTSLQTKKTTDSGNLNVTGLPTFLLPSQSQPLGTYETQGTASYAYSDDASSSSAIAHFPNFQFSLHTITSLSSIFDAAKSFARQQGSARLRRVNILVVILETEGPDTIKLKNGQDAGKEVSIFKMILGDEEGSVCRLTAWRDTADVWGGYGAGPDPPPAMKRGDVVYFENILVSTPPREPRSPTKPRTTIAAMSAPVQTITLIASSTMRPPPCAQLCYRTLPSSRPDAWLRPDLRLGQSDAAVRRVGGLVRWFEGVAGVRGA